MKSKANVESPFLRQTSGLRKDVGLISVALFGIHCISLSSSGLIPFSWVASNWPGASILGLLVIAAVTSLFHAYSFAAIGACMPRAGADYVLSSRLLHPVPAFVASWTLVLFSGIALGGLIAWIPKTVVPALFQPLSIVTKDTRWASMADWAVTTSGTLTIGSIVLMVTLLSVLLPNRQIIRLMSIGLLLGIAAWIVIYVSLLSANSPAEFREAWDRFVGPTSEYGLYDRRVDLATKAGMKISDNASLMTLGGLIMGFWIYYGYAIPTYFAGELKKNAHRYLLYPMLISVVVTCIIFSIGTILLQRLVPLEWIAAEGYIANNADAVTSAAGKAVPAYPWITFYAAILLPRPWLMVFVAIAWIFTLINLFQTYFFYSSRVVFAWGFDGVFPARFADVTRSSAVPRNSLLLVAGLALLGLLDAAFNGPIGPQLTFAFFAVVTQLVSVLAITIYPFCRPREFATKPPFVRKTIWGFPLLTIIGILTLLYLLWIVYAQFAVPGVKISSPEKTLSILATMIASGLIWYYVRDWHLRRTQGLGLTPIYKLNPPDKDDE